MRMLASRLPGNSLQHTIIYRYLDTRIKKEDYKESMQYFENIFTREFLFLRGQTDTDIAVFRGLRSAEFASWPECAWLRARHLDRIAGPE